MSIKLRFSKFISFASKQKSKVFLVVLCLVLVGFLIPQIAYAAWWCGFAGVFPGGVLACNAANVASGGAVNDAAGASAQYIAGYLLYIPLWATGLAALIAKTLLSWVIGLTIALKITTLNSPTNLIVTVGWPIVRNFANIVIVVGLIIIALATILGIKSYEAKQLLAKLIIAAVLINFSLVICGVFIDASTITVAYMFSLNGSANNNGNSFFTSAALNGADDMITNPATRATTPFAVRIGVTVGTIFYNIMSALTLSLYIFLFLFRIMALWILVILSPLAFACYVLPATKNVFDMWWKNFTQWCFIGVFGSFFYFLGEKLMNAGANAIVPPAPSAVGILGTVALSLGPLFGLLVPGFFLVIGFMFSLQTSAIGANYAIAGFNKAKGYATSGLKASGKWSAKWAADNTGLTRAKNAAQYYATRAGEGWLFHRGQANKDVEARNSSAVNDKDRTARANAMTDQEIQRELRNPSSVFSTVEGQKDRAAMLNVLEKRKKLSMLSDEEQMEALRISQKYHNQEDTQRVVASMSNNNKRLIVNGVDAAGNPLEYEQTVRDAALGALAAKGQINTLPQADLMAALERSNANGMDLKEVIAKLNAQNKAHILTGAPGGLLNQNARDAALSGLAADQQLHRLSEPMLVAAMQQSLDNGLDLKDVVKALDGIDAAHMLENDEFDGPTRAKILKALADKKQTDLLDQGELIYQTIQAQAHGEKPEDIVKNFSSENQAYIANTRPPLLSEAARGAAVESLRKKKELNRIAVANRPAAYAEALRSGGTDIEDLVVGDHRAAPLDRERMRRLENENPAAIGEAPAAYTARIENIAVNEALDENIGSYSKEQLADIEPVHLTRDTTIADRALDPSYQRVKKLTPDKIKNFQNAPQPVRAALRGATYAELERDMLAESNDATNATLGFPGGTSEGDRNMAIANGGFTNPPVYAVGYGYDPLLINAEQARYHTAEAGKLRGLRAAINRLAP